MSPISVVLAEFVVYIFTYLSILVSTDDENIVFWNATGKGGSLVTEGDEDCFFTNIGKAVA